MQTIVFQILASLYGVFNLDFFRTLIPPICLPLNTMQVIALDYLVAVYPLLVLVCVYVLVSAHNRRCGLVIQIWRPFLSCFARMRQQFNLRRSMIDAFATFILLSYIKLVSVSGDLIIPVRVYNINGSTVGYFMYYNATIRFMSSEHLPYFIMSITVGIIVASFPLLLVVYPTKWCQTVLNKFNWNSSSVRMLMECFQGYYRDRSDGGWDCRYYAAVYPTLRILCILFYTLVHSIICISLYMLLLVAVVLYLILVHPYKKQFSFYNKMDIVLLLSLMAFCASLFVTFYPPDWDQIPPSYGYVMGTLVSTVPFFYLTMLFFRNIKQMFTHSCSHRRYNNILLLQCDSININ